MGNVVKYYKQWSRALISSNGQVQYYNFLDKQTADEIWFTGFLKSRGFCDRFSHTNFAFFSTLGSVQLLRVDELLHPFGRNRKRVFFHWRKRPLPRF